jgi:hypothetical protein
MKSRAVKIFWTTLIVLVVVLVVLPRPQKKGVEQSNSVAAPSYATKKLVEDRKNPVYSVDIDYPEIKLPEKPEIEKKVNADIAARTDAVIKSFAVDVEGGLPHFTAVSSITGRSKVEYLNKSILSYVEEYSEYVSGYAHPNNFGNTYTYDLRTGLVIKMADLFKANSNYLPTIADYAKAAMNAKFADSSSSDQAAWIENGTAPTGDNYKNFLISQEGFVVLFDPYQVAPYAAGEQRVVIPYAALERFVDPGGLLPLRGD